MVLSNEFEEKIKIAQIDSLFVESENEASDPLIASRPARVKVIPWSSICFSLTVSGPNLVSWAETGNESSLTMINRWEIDR